MSNISKILRLETSLRQEGSLSRAGTEQVIQALLGQYPQAEVVTRDLSDGLPLIDEVWTVANYTPIEQRSAVQKAVLALSDCLVDELDSADIVVMGLPIYNFSVSAATRAWVDLIVRSGRSFRYPSEGPVGLLRDRPVYVVYASGGVPMGSAFDFATPYMKQVLGFVGIQDVHLLDSKLLDAKQAELAVSKG